MKNPLNLNVNVFSTKVLIGNIEYFCFSYRRRDLHVTWTAEPREGLAVCRAKSAGTCVLIRPWESNPRQGSKYNIPRSINRKSNKRSSNVIYLVL